MSDTLVKRLLERGIDLAAPDGTCRFTVYSHGPEHVSALVAARQQQTAQLRASCLMVTRGNVRLLRHSVECYRRQTHASRELIVVTDAAAAPAVDAYLKQTSVPNAMTVGVEAAPSLTLGDLRNIATARASGDVLFQWDDDDLFDPRRIEAAVAVLKQSGAAAAFLTRWLVWWPRRKVAVISNRRLWEGSMAVWREFAPVYPSIARGEDSAGAHFIAGHHPIALMDAPCHYIYAVTGENTWDTGHFELMIEKGERVFRDAEFDALNRLLALRVPVLDYERQLRDGLPIA
jgi:glycosyltransferase involved in cell wall biosynthesis